MLAKHALYQLSYGPEVSVHFPGVVRGLVGPGRLELPTSRLSGVRSNQLSYGPLAALEPAQTDNPWARDRAAVSMRRHPLMGARPAAMKERETKTAAACTCSDDLLTTK